MTYTMTIRKNTIRLNTIAGTITGDTYGAKEVIKDEFAGIRWDGLRKCWALDGREMQAIIDGKNDWLTRAYRLEAVIAKAQPVTADKVSRSPCRHCGTYCYGDCMAS